MLIRTNKEVTKATTVQHFKICDKTCKKQEVKLTKKRILVIAGQQGRNLVEILLKETHEEFSVKSILKGTLLTKIL